MKKYSVWFVIFALLLVGVSVSFAVTYDEALQLLKDSKNGQELTRIETEQILLHPDLAHELREPAPLGSNKGSRGLNELDETIFFEGFEDGLPEDWTVIDNLDDGYTWVHYEGLRDNDLGWEGNYMICDSDAAPNGIHMIDKLLSPTFDCSGQETVYLSFDNYFNYLPDDSAYVAVSVNEGDSWEYVWVEVFDNFENQYNVDISEVAAGEEAVMLSFTFNDDGGWHWYWAIDNVHVHTELDEAPSGNIVGSVWDHLGEEFAIGDADIHLYDADGELLDQTATDEAGNFSFIALPPGIYGVGITPLCYESQFVEDVEVIVANDTDVEAGMVPVPGMLEGFVYDYTEDEVLEEVTVNLFFDGELMGSTITNNFGAYSFIQLPEATYTTEAYLEGYVTYVEDVDVSFCELTLHPIYLVHTPPSELTAELDQESGIVDLAWVHDGLGEFLHYNVYRNDALIDETTELFYQDDVSELPSDEFSYQVLAIYEIGMSELSEPAVVTWVNTVGEQTELPSEYSIGDPYPNPFNPELNVVVSVPVASEMQVAVYNTLGREVATMHRGQIQPGYHHLTWQASDFTSGIYFVRVAVPGHLDLVKKVVLMK